MLQKIKNYFRNRYIIKTYKNVIQDIKNNDFEFEQLLNKYDLKKNIDDKILDYTILRVAFELKEEKMTNIKYVILSLYLKNLKETFDYPKRNDFLEIYLLKLEKRFIELKLSLLTQNTNINKKPDFSPIVFSTENFEKAYLIIQNLIENNENISAIKSYESLSYSKTSIELAFYYLVDCVKFDKHSKIYNNTEFKSHLNFLQTSMLMTYFEINPDKFPKEKTEQIKFKTNNSIDVGTNQYEMTKLIKWRNKEQWKSWAEAYNPETKLGKLCIDKSNEK